MKNLKIINILSLLLFVSCSSTNLTDEQRRIFKRKKTTYNLTDHSGQFTVIRESGLRKNKRDLVNRVTIYPEKKIGQRPLEQSATVSTPGMLKNVSVLRPNMSRYYVWFDDSKDRYTTTMKVNLKKKSMDIVLKSPEKQWNGKETIPFPKGTGVFCFYSQLIDCVKFTGFINMAIKKDVGKMNFHIIWDGYPYIQEQFVGLKKTVFSRAIFEYEGVGKDGEIQFSLKVENQSMFYFLDKNLKVVKQFWASQGYSLIRDGYK